MTFEQIISDLKKKIYAPVYFLSGDEPYFIDHIADHIENNVLSDSEKEFNESILYGKDLDVPTLISYVKRYPMMSNYQVVIVKEAQNLKGLLSKDNPDKDKVDKDDTDIFAEYLKNPLPSTLLVLCYKHKKVDKRTKLYKALQKHAVVFDSKKLYDNKIPAWIEDHVQRKGFTIEPKALQLMSDYLGNDLSKIANEFSKLELHLKPGDRVTTELVHKNIDISKDFNIFELLDALGKRNVYKSNLIVQYFKKNPKNNPFVMTVAQLYGFFLKVLTYHSLKDRSRPNVASALGVNPFFVSDYETAARAYPREHCIRNISTIREYDNRSKGIRNANVEAGDLLRELVFKIIH